MAGDFNMTEKLDQRRTTSNEGTGHLKGEELDEWNRMVKATNLYLLEQDLPTYFHIGMSHSSVIDRAYTNLHVGWQQEFDSFCDAFHLKITGAERVHAYHLPIRFGIVPSQVTLRVEEVIQPWVTNDENWEKWKKS